jgi:hypothetical protein
MSAAIEAHRPTYRFRLMPDSLEGDWRLDGDADDGLGPGRLFVEVTRTAGSLVVNPCLDRDFRQGGACDVRLLGNGDRLVLRDVVEANDTRSVVIVLIHPDRSGVGAEASNFSMLGGFGPIGPRDDRVPSPSRADPLYTVDELAELVIAVDRTVRRIPLP